MDSWFLAAVRGSDGNEKMVAEDPLRQLCLGRLKNIPSQIVCVALVILQAVLLNHHLASTTDVTQWGWLAGDLIVVVSFIITFYLREWRLKLVASKHKESTGFAKGLPLGSLSWLLYAVLLGARVSIVFKNDLHHDEEIVDLKLTISITAITCVLFTIGHHHNHESLARRAAILALAKMFTIDLLDTVDILDVLFETAKENPGFSVSLENFVLAIVTLNLMRPTIVLISLFIDHFGSPKTSLKVKVAKSIVELLMLNIPLLCIRVYISVHYDDQISVFLVKNILAIMYGVIEIYDCCHDMLGISKDEDAPQQVAAYTNGGSHIAEENKLEIADVNGVTVSENKNEVTI